MMDGETEDPPHLMAAAAGDDDDEAAGTAAPAPEEEEEAVVVVPMGGSAVTSPLATEGAADAAPTSDAGTAAPQAAEPSSGAAAAAATAAPPTMPSDPPPSPPQGKDPRSGGGSPKKDGGEVGAYARVEVTDPQQHGEGRSRYTTYHLIVHPASPGTKAAEVNRRYSDFQWLYRRLLRERPGSVVPLIPHVSALTRESRFSDEVVNFRRRSCEVWLTRIVRHPELTSSPSLSAFLRSEDELFAEAKRSGDVDFSDQGDDDANQTPLEWGGSSPPPPPAGSNNGGKGGGKERFRRIKALASKVKVSVRNTSNLERSDDEPAFEEIHDYVTELETQIGWLSKHAAALVKTYKDQSAVLESMGSKFAALGGLTYPNTHSGNAARLSTLLNKIGDGVSAVGLNELRRGDELSERFERPVQDLVRDVQSLKNALHQRREIQIGYTDRVSKVRAKETALENIKDNPRDDPAQREVRENDARGAVLEAREAADKKRAEFDAVTARVLREVERFRSQFRDAVRGAVREWAAVQGEYYGKSNGSWDDVMPFLADDGGNDAGGGWSLSSSTAAAAGRQQQQNGGGAGAGQSAAPQLDSV